MRISNNLMALNARNEHHKNMKDLYNLNKQLGGSKIQNSFEDAGVYVDGMRLNYEVTTLEQVIKTSSKAKTLALNADKSLNEFTMRLEQFKKKLIQGANDIHTPTSREALASDLRGIRSHLINIANTSINGHFLFSGTAISVKPISQDGNYHGNNEKINALVGSQVQLPYNLPGFDLFIGKDNDYIKHLSGNVKLTNQVPKFDKMGNLEDDSIRFLKNDDKILNLVGKNYRAPDDIAIHGELTVDTDFAKIDNFPNTVVYMQGRKPNGETFTGKFQLTSDASMQDLLDKIGENLGNDVQGKNKIVDVYLNDHGQINIKDLKSGNQLLDVHIIAATDQKANVGQAGNADQIDLDALKNQQNLHITEIIKSNYIDNQGNPTSAFSYDKVNFIKDGSVVHGSIAQVVRNTNEFAKDTTKLSEVAGGKPYLNAIGEPINDGKFNIDNQKLNMDITSLGKDINGIHKKYKVIVDLDPNDAKVTIQGNGVNLTTSIFHGEYDLVAGQINGKQTPAKDVTYKQLNDIIAMVASDNIPASTTFEDYNLAIKNSLSGVNVEIDYKGNINLKDLRNAKTPIDVSIYDNNGGKFNNFDSNGIASQTSGSFMVFSGNNSIIIDEPKIDIFKDLDTMIEAVSKGYYRSDSEVVDSRNPGIQGAIERLDHIADHIEKEHSRIGSYSIAINSTFERAETLNVNVKTIKSEIMDADYGETMMKIMQRSLSYQAMLSSIAKVNSLSLVNYI